MGQIAARDAKYIKLGQKGAWESLCLRDGTLRLAYNAVPHDLAMSGDREALRRHFLEAGLTRGIATAHANQVADFYIAGPETLWITFSAGYLWWAIAEGEVEMLEGSPEAIAEGGSRLRRTRDGWHKTSIGGAPLQISELNGALTKTAAYRMTICTIEPFEYLIRKINDQDLPEVSSAKAAKTEILKSIRNLMRLLQWRDFELLVELVFAQSGWRRVSVSGGSQKTIDIELLLPSTGERAFVQVKSQTDQAQLDDYVERFEARDDTKMFYVYHTAKSALASGGDNVLLVGPERLSEMVLESGLFDWLLRKAG